MIPVASSTIARIGFDKANSILMVEFRNGNIYQYFDVPEAVFEGLKQAESAGRYLNLQVKGVFRYARV